MLLKLLFRLGMDLIIAAIIKSMSYDQTEESLVWEYLVPRSLAEKEEPPAITTIVTATAIATTATKPPQLVEVSLDLSLFRSFACMIISIQRRRQKYKNAGERAFFTLEGEFLRGGGSRERRRKINPLAPEILA